MNDLYLAPITLEQSLLALRANYEKNANVDLDAKAPSALATYCGYKDIKARNRQIQIIESFARIPIPDKNSPGQKDAYIQKMRLMIAVCYLVKQQISVSTLSNGSELDKLLDDALHISPNNQLDAETLQNCLLVFECCDLSKLNAHLNTNKIKPIEWNNLKTLSSSLRPNIKDNPDSAITQNLSTFTGIILYPVGWGFGFALGKTIGQAGQTGVVKDTITRSINAGLVLFAPITGFTGSSITMFTRHVVDQAVVNTSAFSAAQLCGYGTKKVGQMVGWTVGKTGEYAHGAMRKLGKITYNYFTSSTQSDELNMFIGVDVVNEELSSKSSTLSPEEVIDKANVIIQGLSNEVQEKSTLNKNNAIPFNLTKAEHQLLPDVISYLRYDSPEELLEFQNDSADLTDNEDPLSESDSDKLKTPIFG